MWMSKEQFGFLDNTQDFGAIGLAQEDFHLIKFNKNKYLILKLYLVKSYDKVNWDLLRLVLLQVGLSLEATN